MEIKLHFGHKPSIRLLNRRVPAKPTLTKSKLFRRSSSFRKRHKFSVFCSKWKPKLNLYDSTLTWRVSFLYCKWANRRSRVVLSRVWKSRQTFWNAVNIYRNPKIKFYKSHYLTVLLYVWDTWMATNKILKKIKCLKISL